MFVQRKSEMESAEEHIEVTDMTLKLTKTYSISEFKEDAVPNHQKRN